MTVMCLVAERIGKKYALRMAHQINGDLARKMRSDVVKDNVGRHIEMREMSYEVVNRLQQYLECDRVTLAILRGSRTQVKAISNQALFDRRSNVVRRIERLSRQVARIEEPLWQPSEDDEQLAPQLRDLVQSYFDAANTQAVAMIPIMAEPKRRDDPEDIAATIRSTDERKKCGRYFDRRRH